MFEGYACRRLAPEKKSAPILYRQLSWFFAWTIRAVKIEFFRRYNIFLALETWMLDIAFLKLLLCNPPLYFGQWKIYDT